MWNKEMLLDRPLADDLYGPGGYHKGPDDLYGVEVELEGKNICNPGVDLQRLWAQHDDGSLRARNPGDEKIEYVLAKPLGLADTLVATAGLFNYLNKAPAEVYDSYRTSIHVHVNCLNESQRVIANFIALAIITDELFVSLNGEHRQGNNFCLRASDAEGMVHMLVKSVEDYGQIYQLNQEHRYSSVNVAALKKFGTIEFRSMECTTNFNRMSDWIRTLHNLKLAAREFKDPREIIQVFSGLGPVQFLWRVLGHQSLQYAAVPQVENMLFRGMRLAQDFAFCSDWKTKKADAADKPQAAKRGIYGGRYQQIDEPVPRPAERVLPRMERDNPVQFEEDVARLARDANVPFAIAYNAVRDRELERDRRAAAAAAQPAPAVRPRAAGIPRPDDWGRR